MNSTLDVAHTVLPATLRAANRPDCACLLMVHFAGKPLRENDGDPWIRQQPSGVQQTSLFKNVVSQVAIECTSKVLETDVSSAGDDFSDDATVSVIAPDEMADLVSEASDESNDESAVQPLEVPESGGLKSEALSSVEPAVTDALDTNDGNESDSDDDGEEEECCNESDQEEDAMTCTMG